MKIQKRLVVVALSLMGLIQAGNAQIFDYSYTPEYLPNDPQTIPTWQQPLPALNTTASVDNNILTIASTAPEGYLFYRQAPGEAWDGGAANTLEFVFKVNSILDGVGFSQSIGIFTGSYAAILVVSPTAITNGAFFGQYASYALDATQFHSYWFTTSETGLMNVYIDQNPTPVMSFQMEATTANYFEFGATSPYGGGTVEWSSVKWTNQGAFAPVPEPASFILLGLAALVIVPLHRRWRKA